MDPTARRAPGSPSENARGMGRARTGKKWQTSERATKRQNDSSVDKTEVDDSCADGKAGGGRQRTKARAMDGFSFGFLTRLPKFRSQIQF